MIHRHSSPARGWHRCKLQPVWLNGITQYNEKRFTICRYKYKRTTIPALRAGWRQIAAATGVYHNWGDTIHPHRFNTQPAARYVANITCADEWYDPIYGTKCSGVDPTPSSPGEGLAPWDATDTNVQRVALRPMAADCRRYSGVYHVLGGTIHPHRFNIQRGGRQVAAPTSKLLQMPYI